MMPTAKKKRSSATKPTFFTADQVVFSPGVKELPETLQTEALRRHQEGELGYGSSIPEDAAPLRRGVSAIASLLVVGGRQICLLTDEWFDVTLVFLPSEQNTFEPLKRPRTRRPL